MTSFEDLAEEGVPVELPSGATYYTITHAEAEYLRDLVERYLNRGHKGRLGRLIVDARRLQRLAHRDQVTRPYGDEVGLAHGFPGALLAEQRLADLAARVARQGFRLHAQVLRHLHTLGGCLRPELEY